MGTGHAEMSKTKTCQHALDLQNPISQLLKAAHTSTALFDSASVAAQESPKMMCVQLMTNALSLKDNANNVYKDNVNKRGTFEGVRLIGQEEKKRYRSCSKETISVTGPLTFQLSSAVMYIACTT